MGRERANRGAYKRYEDLTESDFRACRSMGGRYHARYWDGTRHRMVMRARWVWEQEHGPIPKGIIIHHKNEKCWDDRYANLEAMKRGRHNTKHFKGVYLGDKSPGWKGGKPRWVCETCGKNFQAYTHTEETARYCLPECSAEGKKDRRTLVCDVCKKEFERTPGKIKLAEKNGSKRIFCSRSCYRKWRRNDCWATLVCGYCGKSFKKVKSQTGASKSGKSFCSRACSNRAHRYMIWESRRTNLSQPQD